MPEFDLTGIVALENGLHEESRIMPTDPVQPSHRRVGRPAIFEKRLKRTFMVDHDADAMLTRKAKEMGCSRSDILIQALRAFDRRHKVEK
jgi:hypothetical protein